MTTHNSRNSLLRGGTNECTVTITGGSFFVGTSLPYTFASLELDLKETYVSIVSMLYLLLDVRTASIISL